MAEYACDWVDRWVKRGMEGRNLDTTFEVVSKKRGYWTCSPDSWPIYPLSHLSQQFPLEHEGARTPINVLAPYLA